MNRKLELGIGISIILLIVTYISINLFKTSFDSERSLITLKTAIDRKDIEYIKKHIKIDGKSDIKNDEIEKIAELLKKKGSKNIKYYDKTNNYKENIYIIKSGKEKLVYDKFVLNINTIDMILYTNIEGAEIFLDDKSIGKTDSAYTVILNDIVPGYYDIKVKYSSKYAKGEKSKRVELYKEVGNEIEANIDLDLGYITVYSNNNNATLYINDIDTGLLVKNINEFGPLNIDGSVNIQAKVDDSIESEKHIVDAAKSYNLNIEEEMESPSLYTEGPSVEIFRDLIYNYEVGMVDAINNNDFSHAEPYILSGSKLDKMQRNLVKGLNKEGTTEKFLDFTILDIEAVSNDEYKLRVIESHKLYKSDGSTEDVENTWRYTVKRIGARYYLSNLRGI